MSRHCPFLCILMSLAVLVSTGCQPQQPFFFHEGRNLDQYLDQAIEANDPDVEEPRLAEVEGALPPFSLQNPDTGVYWDLSLEEAVQNALTNGKILKSLGGRVEGAPDFLLRSPEAAASVYDVAIVESNPRSGVEAALSAFDVQFTNSVFWEKIDSPQNSLVFLGSSSVFPRISQQDLGSFQSQLAKTTATGGTWQLGFNANYNLSNSSRLFTSDWQTSLEAGFRQPLLQGAGTQINRIQGPGAIPGFNNGVMIARINTDITLADFEGGLQNFVLDVETAYWRLYLAYRNLRAAKVGRDSALQTWREVKAKADAGAEGGAADLLAQAQQQVFTFEGTVKQAQNALYDVERNLRYVMGLAPTDGRLIRPSTEPTTAEFVFDWHESHETAMCRNVQLRKQRWLVKRRELEMITAKNYLLPRLDAIGTYRFKGLGDDLWNLNNGSGDSFQNAMESMMTGNYQEWKFGLEYSMDIGFRKAHSGVRHAELNLAKERERLRESELELTSQLASAIADAQSSLKLAVTSYNTWLAARQELKATEAKYEMGVTDYTLDRVLRAQERLAQAESQFYQNVVNYNTSLATFELRKGTLLDNNNVTLTEGPWADKAYFDAHRRARARSAALPLDYGYTRPKVVSRGPVDGMANFVFDDSEGMIFDEEGVVIDKVISGGATVLESGPERVPTPAPEPREKNEPTPAEPSLETGASTNRSSRSVASRIAAVRADEEVAPSTWKAAGRSASSSRKSASAKSSDQWSAVRRAGYTERPATSRETGQRKAGNLKQDDKKPAGDRWARARSTSNQHEILANSATPETDWAASVGPRL